MAVAASAPLFNYAVSAYNSSNFAEAVEPLRAACEVSKLLLMDICALPSHDVAQVCKHVCIV
jgi:hypothetical protein